MKRNFWLLALLPLLALAFMAAAVPQQSNVATYPATSSMLGMRGYEVTGPTSNRNVTYHGGPIMNGTSVDYLIFWEPTGSKVPATFNSLIERYFHDVGNSPLYHNNIQYTDKQGGKPQMSSFGGAWVDTQPYPANPIIDKQEQQEVTHAMKVNGWTASLQHVFFVFTVKGEIVCFNQNHKQCSNNVFCAYHSWFNGDVIYGVMPDVLCGTPDSPNHDPQADNVIDSTSHEQNEAATDPLGNAWYNSHGAEIGDLCSTSYGPLKYQGGDVLFNGHPYTLQEEWDNAKSGCTLKGP